jgi:hypothetical protein
LRPYPSQLEAVEEQPADRVLVAGALGERALQVAGQRRAVREPGQAVARGGVRDPVLDHPPLGDVAVPVANAIRPRAMPATLATAAGRHERDPDCFRCTDCRWATASRQPRRALVECSGSVTGATTGRRDTVIG